MGLNGRAVPLDKPVRDGALLLESVLEGVKAAANKWLSGKYAEGDTPDLYTGGGLGERLHALEHAPCDYCTVGRSDEERYKHEPGKHGPHADRGSAAA